MSLEAMTWAMALPKEDLADPSARHVLLCLANHAGHQGEDAFPSALTLAERTGLSERTVRYKLDLLEELGLITRGLQAIAALKIQRHDRRPVVYDLQLKRGANAAPRSERGANGDASEVTGCKPQHNGVQSTTERGAAVAPKPSFNRPLTEEQQQRAIDEQVQQQDQDALDTLDDQGEWQRYAMFPDWTPNERHLAGQSHIAGVKRDAITDELIRRFKGYFVAKPRTVDTSAGWTHRLVGWFCRERAQSAGRATDPDFNDTDWANDMGDL